MVNRIKGLEDLGIGSFFAFLVPSSPVGVGVAAPQRKVGLPAVEKGQSGLGLTRAGVAGQQVEADDMAIRKAE